MLGPVCGGRGGRLGSQGRSGGLLLVLYRSGLCRLLVWGSQKLPLAAPADRLFLKASNGDGAGPRKDRPAAGLEGLPAYSASFARKASMEPRSVPW